MNQSEAIAILDAALAKIPNLKASNPGSAHLYEFIQTTGIELARIFGSDSLVSRNFAGIGYTRTGSVMTSALTYERDLARASAGAYMHGLSVAEGVLMSARAQLAAHGVDKILRTSRVRNEGPNVFISHGTQSSALTRLERFVRALGAQPVIVMLGASEGMAVDALVEQRLSECDCAIILATADDKVGSYMQPRMNVIHEIGLAQERLANKVIYLKEQGCEFPSNIRPKVWESFTQENMEAAFEKVAKELQAFGLL